MKELNFKKTVLITSLIACIAIGVISCNNSKKQQAGTKTPDTHIIFPKGKKVTNNNFRGSAWLTMLVENDTLYDTQIGNVTFEPGARTNWHYHKGGQILLVIEGKGYYQVKGKRKQIIKKGEVVKCPPNIIHWHGATPNDTLIHVAISTNTSKGSVVWLEPVNEEEYNHL